MADDKGIHVRAALIVVQDAKILLVPHFNTDMGPIQYNLPGGRLEFGEALETAALREFQEETGFLARSNGFFDIYEHHKSDWHSITVAYYGHIIGGELRSEISPWGERVARWFSREELNSFPYHPIPLVDHALEQL